MKRREEREGKAVSKWRLVGDIYILVHGQVLTCLPCFYFLDSIQVKTFETLLYLLRTSFARYIFVYQKEVHHVKCRCMQFLFLS